MPQVVDSRFGIGISEDIGTWQRTRLEEVGEWVGLLAYWESRFR